MNSLELYRQYLRESRRFTPDDKAFYLSEIVTGIVAELNAPPFEFNNSSFIAEALTIIKNLDASANKYFPMHWQGKSITLVDAYFVIIAVKKSFDSDNYSMLDDAEIFDQREFFFVDSTYTYEKELIKQMAQDLNDVRNILQKYRAQAEREQKNFQAEVQPTPVAEMLNLEPSAVAAQNKTASPILRQAQSTAPPVQIPAKSTTKSVMEDYAAKTTAQIELQKHRADVEKERTEQLKLRLESNRKKISAWQEQQANLAQSLKNLQEPTQNLLEDLRNFSKKLTEDYVTKFAFTQIDLFNLIADNFNYHAPRAEKSQSDDYYNAVENYRGYLEIIIDALADFGIEEISSKSGTRFDGRIHEVKNTQNFSPRTATIRKSLRSGFKYGELVLQKEEVEL